MLLMVQIVKEPSDIITFALRESLQFAIIPIVIETL